MDLQAKDLMAKAKTMIVVNHPFFATLLLSMPLNENADIPTMCVDGISIEYNPAFVNKIGSVHTMGVLCHEVMHAALMHPWRLSGRNHAKWNQACDYVINDMLKQSGIDLPQPHLYSPAFTNMSADEVYTMLPDPPPGGGGMGAMGQDLKEPGSNNDPNGQGQDSRQQQVSEAQMKVKVAQATAIAKAMGQMPAGMQKTIDELLNPKAPWQDVLRKYFTSITKDDQSWARGQRRFLSQGLYLPAMHSPALELAVCAIDTSGSIYDRADEFLAEVDTIRRECNVNELLVIQCDAKVQAVKRFGRHDDARLTEVKGGGGTSFVPPFAYLAKRDIIPNVMVYLTDLEGSFPKQPDYPVIWAATTEHAVPFGDVVRL